MRVPLAPIAFFPFAGSGSDLCEVGYKAGGLDPACVDSIGELREAAVDKKKGYA